MSLKAVDKNGCLVYIDKAIPGDYYYCQICGQPMLQRRGDVRIHHFSHYSPHGHSDIVPCSDNWGYDKTEWHMEWQKRFPVDNMERVLELNGKKHIADVLVENVVVEFQHSPISLDEFNERNEFYTNLGHKVVWVFDLIEDADIGRIHEGAIEGYYQWAFAKKLFKEIELKSVKATVYFQLSNHDSDEGVLERVTFIGAKGKQIKTDSNYALSITEFVNGVNANDDLLFGRPKKPIAPDLLPDCNTIEELWNESYLKMIVRNTFSGDIIYVYGKDGKLTKDFQTGKIRCSYANINKTTGLFYPKEGFYNAFDGDKRIWKLVHAFKDPKHEQRMKDLENIAKLDTDGYQTIDEITQHNTSRSLIVDNLYTKKKYFLSFVNDFGRYTRFDIYEVDLESGTLSDTPLNGSLYLLYNQKIWKIVTG